MVVNYNCRFLLNAHPPAVSFRPSDNKLIVPLCFFCFRRGILTWTSLWGGEHNHFLKLVFCDSDDLFHLLLFF